MRIGIKVGPSDWQEKLTKAKFQGVEVYYRYDRAVDYAELFEFLQQEEIYTGLHFWGLLANWIKPNIMTNDQPTAAASLKLLCQTIDTASRYGFNYVIEHASPANLMRLTADLQLETLPVPKDDNRRQNVIRNNLNCLNEYAKQRGTQFLIETTTKNEAVNWSEDALPEDGIRYNVGNPSPEDLLEIAQKGTKLCLDTAHLTTWFTPANDRKELLAKLKACLLKLQPYASVLHLASLKPPYLVDTTNGFTPEEESRGVFPNHHEALKILELFQDSDVLVVPEPLAKDHLWHNNFLNSSGLFN